MHSHCLIALKSFFIVLFLLVSSVTAFAQTVRYEEPSGSLSREGNRAAEDQDRHDWVDLRNGETGTHVVLSSDLTNADVIIFTNIGFGIEPLLAESKKIAARLDLPKTDFIVYKGRKTTHGVDLECNDYLQKKGRRESLFVLNLARLRAALESSALPRPITIFDDHSSPEITSATLQIPGKPARRITEAFFALNEIPDGAEIRYDTTIPWYGYPVAFAVFG